MARKNDSVKSEVELQSDDLGMPVMAHVGSGGRAPEGPPAAPSVVEVQFRPDVVPQLVEAATVADSLASAAGIDLHGVQAVLQRYGPERVEPSFGATLQEADAAAEPGAESDDTSLRSFVRFHFSPDADLAEIAAALDQLPEVERAVPVPQALPPKAMPDSTLGLEEPLAGTGDVLATDPVTRLDNQWYLFRCRADRAWGTRAGEGVVVADIDWGYRTTHQDLAPNLDLQRAYNSFDGSRNVSHGTQTSHGTAVLGIAGGALNRRGIAGFAPRAVLWPIQANSGAGALLPGDPWANAIEHVRRADSGGRRKVIILEVQTGTLGNYEMVPSVNEAIRRAIASNVVVCVAAGNGDRNAAVGDDGKPIRETGSILVGATRYDPKENRRAPFSNFGDRIVVAAPGDADHDVTCSIAADNAYQNRFGGTSGATPKVAGTVALMLAENPRLTHEEVKQILRSTGSSVISEPSKPVGTFLNSEAAVREARRRLESPPQPDLRPAPRPAAVLGAVTAGPPPLRSLLETAGSLSRTDRLRIVDQAILLLEQFYVHRLLKEAMHAVRPVQRLKLLRSRLEQTPEGKLTGELQFHNEMSDIFISLRDLHTTYQLPEPYRSKTAYLPFLVEEYFADGEEVPGYVVSKLVPGFSHPTFGPGVEVLHWNGVPIGRAVEASARTTAGSNLEARRARGLDALTLRPMFISLPPEAEWVVVGYRTPDGAEHELRQEWLILSKEDGGNAPAAPDGKGDAARKAAMGIDFEGDEIGRSKQILFAPEVVEEARRRAGERAVRDPSLPAGEALEALAAMGIDLQADFVRAAKQALFAPAVEDAHRSTAAAPSPAEAEGIASHLPEELQARAVATPHGDIGYVRIFTFKVKNIDAFVAEFIRLVRLLPRDGLIIDVRGNGGGFINAGERLLQLLTPREIEPEPLQFINTSSTLELCRRNGSHSLVDLSPWRESIESSVATGATYSRGFPLTSRKACNEIGQEYTGPVVLITDARCYSTTDIFAAGFQDHDIGKILGVSGNTGAGGANVWPHGLLRSLLAGAGTPLTPLPRDVDMGIAIRQTVRVHARSGTPVEDLGVTPDVRHRMTRNDVLGKNEDLINRAAALLVEMPRCHLGVEERSRSGDRVGLLARVRGLDRMDFFVNERPKESLDVADGEIPFTVALAPAGSTELLLQGYRGGRLVAACRESF